MADVSEFIESLQPWFAEHLARYQRDGKEGHILDTTQFGGRADTTTLLLKTVGRKSGREFVAPLIYKGYGDEYAIIGSKGGSDQHPAWFHNLQARPELEFQVADKCYVGTWRILAGAERDKVYREMAELYSFYTKYQASTTRQIPVVMLKAKRQIDKL